MQRQQYPLLAEAEVQTKAQAWKTFGDTEQQRRQAMYKDELAQQHTVSTSYFFDCIAHPCTAI